MSGRKYTTTTISVDELRRLREQAGRASSLQQQNNILNQLTRRNEEALRAYENRINSMNNNINNLNSRLSEQRAAASRETQALRSELQNTIRQTNNRLQQINSENAQRIRDLNNSFTSALNQTREEVYNTINENNSRIEAGMRELEGQMNAELQNVHNRLNDIDAGIAEARNNNRTLLDMAREYASTAQTLIDEIRTNYRVDLLCPGQLGPVLAAQRDADTQIRDAEKMPQNSSVARLQAREALEQAHRLYQQVILAEQEWQAHYEAAIQAVGVAAAQLEASRVIDLPEENGNAAVNVDHWTDGDLSSIGERVEGLNGRLKKPDELSLADLDVIQAAGIQADREVNDTTNFAVEAFYASQDRGEIAQDIADQLRESGISIVDHDYQGHDQRSAHRLHLRNHRTGFELVVTQTPVVQQDGTIANRLESDIINYGSMNAEHGDDLAREILSSLSGLGLQQTAVCTEPGFENTVSNRLETTHIQQWRTEKNPEVVKPDHTRRMTTCAS